eukprot:6332147-Prymnesium_polylepis.1
MAERGAAARACHAPFAGYRRNGGKRRGVLIRCAERLCRAMTHVRGGGAVALCADRMCAASGGAACVVVRHNPLSGIDITKSGGARSSSSRALFSTGLGGSRDTCIESRVGVR